MLSSVLGPIFIYQNNFTFFGYFDWSLTKNQSFKSLNSHYHNSRDLAFKDLEDAIAHLETWRKDKNYKLNNTEILLAVTHGQYEVEPQKMSPYLPGAALITESMITKLNQDIQVSLQAMLAMQIFEQPLQTL